MSLRVWLPLNGSLENKGLDDVTVINNGATVDNNGKIGKCYSFDGSNDYFIGNPAPLNSQIVEWSYCCWFKPNKLHNGCLFSNRTSVSETGITLFYYSNYIYFDDGIRWSFIPSTAISVENWNHLVFVRKTSCKQFYLNGVLINETSTVGTNNNNMNSTHFTIGGSQSNNTIVSGNMLNGKLNDVRIYDHALSSMEVKQISQGLILHYPLNHGGLGQENLLSIQVKEDNWRNWKSSNWASNNIQEKIEIDNKTWVHLHQTTSTGYGGYSCAPEYNLIVIDPTKRYTWSCLAKAGNDTNAEIILWCHWRSTEGGANLSQNSQKIKLTSTPTRVFWNLPQYTNDTYHVNRINLMMGVSGTANNEIYFTDVKFEEGLIPTPWSPNSSDPLATVLNIDNEIEYDASGFRNNGTKIGTLDYSSDTPRYNVSTVFPTGNNYINAGRGAMVKDAITVNLWVNYSTWGNPISCTEGGGFNFKSNGSLRFVQYISGIGYKAAQSTIAPGSLTNAWHMFTGTCDKENIYLYIDGELKGTGEVGSTNAFGYNANNAIMIGAEANNSSTTVASASFIGKISDVRIYATALSPEDVLDLYNLGAVIDTNNNLYGVMLEEV